jgi:FkbM family methyltransferase
VNLNGALSRLQPLRQKLRGHLPLCPWRSVLGPLNPSTLRGFPPPSDMSIIDKSGDFQKIRFGGEHDFWFPATVSPTPELWSEYLAVFWNHPSNGHYYFARNGVRSGDICIDCGASEGFFAFRALQSGAAKIVCIEPGQTISESLARTFESEVRGGQVIIRSVALSAIEGTATFEVDPSNYFGGALGGTGSAHQSNIPITTLQRLVSDLSLPRVDFLKMDIEGAELQAIEGGLPILKRFHPRLAITTYHRQFDYAAVRDLLLAAGYRNIQSAGITARGEGKAAFRPIMLHAWV